MQRKLILSSLICGLFYCGSLFAQEPTKLPETKVPDNWLSMAADDILLQMSYPNWAPATMNQPMPGQAAPNAPFPPGVQPQNFPQPPMMGGNKGALSMFTKLREDITAQLRQLTQMTQSLGPQDERLKAMLAEQQRDLLQQLKEVNQQIASAGGPAVPAPGGEVLGMSPYASPSPVMPSMPLGVPQHSPQPPMVGNQPFGANENARRLIEDFGHGVEVANLTNNTHYLVPDGRAKLLQAAQLVREAGFEALSQQILSTIQNGGLPPNAMPGLVNPQPPVGWAGSDPALRSSMTADPFAAAPVKEIAELQQSMAQIKDENAKLVSSIDEIKTQLSLIGHKITNPVETPKE